MCFLLLSAQRFVEYGSYFLKTGLKCVSFGKYESEIYCKCFTYCWVSGTHFACAAHHVPMKHRVEFDIKRASGKMNSPCPALHGKRVKVFSGQTGIYAGIVFPVVIVLSRLGFG